MTTYVQGNPSAGGVTGVVVVGVVGVTIGVVGVTTGVTAPGSTKRPNTVKCSTLAVTVRVAGSTTVGVDFRVDYGPRRAGDPAEIVAASERIRDTLGWKPRFDDLPTIVTHALAWERKLAATRNQ